MPAKQWQIMMARSELLEFVRLLQLCGAGDVKWETMNGTPARVAAAVGSYNIVKPDRAESCVSITTRVLCCLPLLVSGCCEIASVCSRGVGRVATSEGDAQPTCTHTI